MQVAVGLTGLRLLQDFRLETNELKQFKSYLKETEKFTLPPNPLNLEPVLNEEFKAVKNNLDSNNIKDTIKESEMVFHYLHLLHSTIY